MVIVNIVCTSMSLNISIGRVMGNLEVLKFVPDQMCKKKITFLLR